MKKEVKGYRVEQHANKAVPDALLELEEAVEGGDELGAARLPQIHFGANMFEAVDLDAHLNYTSK
jgi:hypothetical protein